MDFDDAIKDHLELRRRNALLERRLPLARYRGAVPVGNAPSFERRPSRVPEETQEYAPVWLAALESDSDSDSDWAWEDGQERR